MLFQKKYQVLNQIAVDTKALLHNYHFFQSKHPQTAIVPVLKSNAYGHGLIPTAKFIDHVIHPPFVAVDSLYEAYELSKQHIKTPILVLGYTLPQNYAIWKQLPFSFSVFDTTTLEALNKHQPGAKIHIKLDTGMCRLGIQPQDLKSFMKSLKTCTQLKIEGVYTHLSQADTSHQFSLKQVAVFKQMVTELEMAGFSFSYKHAAATEAALWLTDPYFNLIRLGLGFYGYSATQHPDLTPALSLSSHLAQVKIVPPKASIGYGGTATTTKATRIGILPIGYADGIDRRLSNWNHFIGRISMNMSTVTVPNQAKTGDNITLISPHSQSPHSVHQWANACSTIPYTILTGLNPTMRRVFL